jgi:hypothetical protein
VFGSEAKRVTVVFEGVEEVPVIVKTLKKEGKREKEKRKERKERERQ